MSWNLGIRNFRNVWQGKEVSIGPRFHQLICIVKGCDRYHDTVMCNECFEFVCVLHEFRHPNCDIGK